MKLQYTLLAIFCLIQQSESWHTVFTRDRPDEYLGCFSENPEDRVFTTAPGDYQADDLSPIQCMVVCGHAFKFASIQNGVHCMCSDRLPTNKTDDKNCPAICQGTLAWPVTELRPRCGGVSTISVYTVENRILGLSVLDPGVLLPRKEVVIQANIKNGKDIKFSFDLGDGDTGTPPESLVPNITHIYDRPGDYEVKITAINNVSGSEIASRWVKVREDPSNVTISCPPATVIGTPIICNGSMGSGSDVHTIISFGDDVKENLLLSALYGSIGAQIPSYENFVTPTKRPSQFTVVVPQAEFNDIRILSSVEVDAFATGDLHMLVLRPRCEVTEEYCHKKHSCIQRGETCIKVNQQRCSENEIFCLFSGRCLPNTDQSMKKCDSEFPFHFSTAPADYEVVHKITVYISKPGHHFFRLPQADHFEARSGDVIGWTRTDESDATLNYAMIQEKGDIAPEFEYASASNVGNVLKRSAAVRKLTHHVFSVHYVQPASFALYHTYTEPGAYLLTSNISRTEIVYADFPISGVKFTCPDMATTNQSFSIEIAEHAGTNTTYWWNFGNGDIATLQERSISYAYPSPGVFRLSMNARNSLSDVRIVCWVRAFDAIQNLALRKPLGPQPLGTRTSIWWGVTRGTNTTFTLKLGDDKTVVIFKPSDRNFSLEADYSFTYNKTGHYKLTIVAENPVGSALSISALIIVEIPLQDIVFTNSLPHVTDSIYIAENDNVSLSVNFRAGTDPYCTYHYGDGKTLANSSYLKVNHIYKAVGTYRANVTCKNFISVLFAPLNVTFVIQKLEPITNMTLRSASTGFNTSTVIYLNMSTGTTFFCNWNLGDGMKFMMDYSRFGISFLHTYRKIGDYQVEVSCSNRLGSKSLSITVSVDIPITLFNATCPPKFLKVNQPIELYQSVGTGSRLRFEYNFGNGDVKIHANKSSGVTIVTTFAYPMPGIFKASSSVSNHFNGATNNCSTPVKVEHPVDKITIYTNSPLKFNPGIVYFYWYKSPGFVPPTDAVMQWNFGDGNTTAMLPAALTTDSLVLRTYRYAMPGIYNVSIHIKNNVSAISFALTVDVQRLLPTAFIAQYPDPITFQMVSGKGPKKDHFPLESKISFVMTSQPRDLFYYFDFDHDSETVNLTVPTMMHQFPRPGSYNVSCLVHNILQVSKEYIYITMIESVKDLKITGPSVYSLGENITFTVSAALFGSNVCHMIDFDDGSRVVFNSTICDEFTASKAYNYTYHNFTYPTSEIKLQHIYETKGFYNIKALSKNFISEAQASLKIEITYRPCDSPGVIVGGGGSLLTPLSSAKSVEQIFQTNLTIECATAEKAELKWQAFSVSTSNMNDESKPINLAPLTTTTKVKMPYKPNPEDIYGPSILRLPARILPFGLVMIKLSITYDSSVDDLSEILGFGKTWLDIQPSPLAVNIRGGTSRAVGFELEHILDGELTYDPDEAPGYGLKGMIFNWYCRKAEESFTENYLTDDSKAGCFENGKFELENLAGYFKLLSENHHNAQINTGKLKQFKTYIIRLVVKKGDKLDHFEQSIKVLPGTPPTMDIRCKLNCKDKISSKQQLKIESVCTDCKPGAALFFLWNVYPVEGQTSDKGVDIKPSTKPITNFEQYTTTGVNGANFAVREDVFEPGKIYLLRVVAWKAGGNSSFGGFSEYKITVNVPPKGGVCAITPKVGYAIATNFTVSCDGWQDEDLPLNYQVDVRKEYQLGNTVDNLQNMYSDNKNEGIFLILPMGKEEDDFKVAIVIKVIDRLGGTTTIEQTIQVKEPKQVDMTAFTNSLNALADGDNVQAVAQRAVAAGSVINKDSSGSGTSSGGTARNAILQSVGKVKACSVDQIKQMGGVFSEMTSKPDEVDESAAGTSSNAMGNMAECMLQADAQDTGLKSATLSLLQGSSNVMQSFQKGSNQSNATSANVTADPAAVNASGKLFDTMDKVGGSYMRQMVSGDKPTVVKTGGMDIQMAQVSDDADEEELGFKLPSTKTVNNVSTDGTKSSVGAMMTSSAKNPFGSGGGSDDLKSDVMGLTLTDAQGNPIDMAGQEIQMFVKRDLTNDIPPDMHAFDGENMKVHKFNYSSLEAGMGIEIKPIDPKTIIQVWIAYGKRPTSTNNLANYTISTLEEAAKMKKLPDPFTYVMTNGGLNGTGEYYLGVKIPNRDKIYSDFGYVPVLNYTLRVYETKCKMWDDVELKWTTEGCLVGPKTTFNKTHCICKIPSEKEELVPTTIAPTTPKTSTGASTGNMVVRKVRKVAKRASFAGGFFVAPNPIDFSKAFAGFANLAENPVAFATVLSILGVYLILLFWARREDRKDVERAGVTPLEENDIADRQFFEIAVFTGFGNNANTTSKVFIQLSGDDGETEPRELKDPNRKLFQSRGQDMFLASFPDNIGDLTYLRIWHDNSGKKPSWYLSRVQITDLNTAKRFLFINENRLAVEEGDGTVERLLPLAGPDEIAGFNHLFYSTTQKNLTDGHLWFSVFIRPAKSRFTRVQRLSCCLTLLYCTMVANAMFYQVGGETDPSTTIHLGPFAFSPSQIGIGIMSSMVIFPANLILVGIFRNVGPKPSPEEMKKRKSRKFWWLRELFFCCDKKEEKSEFMNIITTVGDQDDKKKRKAGKKYDVMEEIDDEEFGLESGEIGFKFEKEDPLAKEKEKKKKKKKKKQLPYWFKYIAWVILFLTSFTSAFFVVLYGFQFGKEKSAQWISSLMISFVQDVCISQPIKILLLGLFIALIVKKPAEDEDEEEPKKKQDEEYLCDEDNNERQRESKRPAGIIRFQPPSKEKIKAAREFRLKELKMYNIVRDIVIYCLFVISLCTVSYTHLDPLSFYYRKSLEDTFVGGTYGGDMSFTAIQSREDLWTWLNTTVVNGLFATHWYNGEPNIPGFTQDLYSNLFGGARIRQLRVKRHSCNIPKEARSIINECNGWYSWSNEDIKQYDVAWSPLKNESVYNPPAYFQSWEYYTSDELGTYPFVGAISAYGGGGYTGDLGKFPQKSFRLIDSLQGKGWIDQQTRALFLEICVYNAQINLFAIMNFVTEFIPTNGVVHFYNIKIARLYTFGGSTQSFTLACQFFVLLFLIVFTYREGKKMYKERKAYFKGFWNLVEFSMIALVIGTISVFFSRLLLINAAVKRIQENTAGSFVSFNKVATWDDLFTYMMSFLVLVSCIKSIRLLQFNKTISILASTLKGCAKPLAAFSIVFVVFFVAYSILGFIVFVQKLSDYSSFVTTMESTMALLLGSFDFHSMQMAERIIAPIYFFSLVLFGVFCVLNVFLTIIMDTYAEVKEDVSKQDNEYEIVDFMIRRFKRWAGVKGAKNAELQELVPESPKLKATKTVRQQRRAAKGRGSHANKKKHFQEHRESLMKKFKQLDNSLNGLCVEDYAEDKFMDELLITGYKGENPFEVQNQLHDMDTLREEAYYQQDLYEELNKWY